MEADKSALVVGFHYQENDRGNDGDIGQHSGHVVGHSCAAARDNRSLRGAATAGRAGGSAVGDLGSAHVAKRHTEFSFNAKLKTGFPNCSRGRTAKERGGKIAESGVGSNPQICWNNSRSERAGPSRRVGPESD